VELGFNYPWPIISTDASREGVEFASSVVERCYAQQQEQQQGGSKGAGGTGSGSGTGTGFNLAHPETGTRVCEAQGPSGSSGGSEVTGGGAMPRKVRLIMLSLVTCFWPTSYRFDRTPLMFLQVVTRMIGQAKQPQALKLRFCVGHPSPFQSNPTPPFCTSICRNPIARPLTPR
jgi:hypothetical protein